MNVNNTCVFVASDQEAILNPTLISIVHARQVCSEIQTRFEGIPLECIGRNMIMSV